MPSIRDRLHNLRTPTGVGLGLRAEFLTAANAGEADGRIAFFEISPENYIRRGGPVVRKFEEIAARMPIISHGLMMSLGALDPSLVVQLKRTADQVRAVVDKLAAKAERVHQNHAGKGRRHERRLQNALFPHGEPQERVLGPFTFVARFGFDWIAELAAAIDPLGAQHTVVYLGADIPALPGTPAPSEASGSSETSEPEEPT